MNLKQLLQEIDNFKAELDKLRPIPEENMSRFTQKIRLEWNYHSNNIEGNQLSYGETKALILFGVTAQAKPMKDHIEIRGHDEAVKYIEEVIKQERPLTENFIRELHDLILHEPYEVDAISPEGQPTKKRISVGKYKETPNHVRTITGEIFRFATPEETPAEMKLLMDWYNNEINNPTKHPVVFAIEFHYRFIRIHPFDDGNGRLARLLMNFIFMQHGYTPAIIKTDDKGNYYRALEQADAGDINYFFEYISLRLIESLHLLLKAANGESIEEPEDLDKKLLLLQKEIENENEEDEIKTRLSIESLKKTFEEWGYALLQKLAETTIKFNKFYDNPSHNVSLSIHNSIHSAPNIQFTDKLSLDKLKEFWDTEDISHTLYEAILRFQCHFGGFKKGGIHTFGCNYTFEVIYETYKYEVFVGYYSPDEKGQTKNSFTQKLLHQSLNDKEVVEISNLWGNALYEHITESKKKLKN